MYKSEVRGLDDNTRTADFQPAVSPIFNRQIFAFLELGWIVFRPVRWKRAIREMNLKGGITVD